MYSNDKLAVKIDNKLTESFTCHAGVKQGCILSTKIPKYGEFNRHYAK